MPLYQSVSLRRSPRKSAAPGSGGRAERCGHHGGCGTRLRSCMAVSTLDLVADAAHRLDERPVPAAVDLVPQIMNVDVHHIGYRADVVAPDVVDDLRPRQDEAGVAHQVLEQG